MADAFVYFPSMYDALPRDVSELSAIAQRGAPMRWTYSRDFASIVAYLCDPRVASNRVQVSPTYLPGTVVADEYTRLRLRITVAPTTAFRQTLLQLAGAPTAANVASYVRVVDNWAGRTMYTDPSDVAVSKASVHQLEVANVAIAVVASFLQLQSRLPADARARVVSWIRALGGVLAGVPDPYGNNIYVTVVLARLMCAWATGQPLHELAAALHDWTTAKVMPDGFITCESREGMTVAYHARCMVVLLLAQCYLRRAGAQVLPPALQARLDAVEDRLDACAGPSAVEAPSFFHTRTGYRGGAMTAPTRGDVAALRQMHAFAFGASHDPATLTDARWMWSSMTFGDLGRVLAATPPPPRPMVFAAAPIVLAPRAEAVVALGAVVGLDGDGGVDGFLVRSRPGALASAVVEAPGVVRLRAGATASPTVRYVGIATSARDPARLFLPVRVVARR